MKILHVITRSDLGGAQTVVLTLSNSMCSANEIIVAAGEDGPMWELFDEKIKIVKIPQIVRQISALNDLRAWLKLRKLYKQEKPDVIHLHSSKIGVLGRLAFPKSKIVYSVHGFDSIRIAYRKFLPFEKMLKNRCKAIVLASEYDRKNISNEGIKNHLFVVYNGIKEPVIDNEIKIEGTENYSKIVMCIARISPQKRFDSFVEIAAKLPKYAFVWIGADEDIKYENIPNLFVLKGFPNAGRYINLADLYIQPSNYEGVPMAIIEALAYSKPVVSSNVGGISEIVRDGNNGYTLPNENEDFIEKLQYILDNESVLNDFGRHSREIFEDCLTVPKMIEKYLNIYQK